VSTRYVVKQGDYLAKIAREHGFTDFLALWNAGENAGLRQKRKDPNVLFPGDVVVIPDAGPRKETGSTEQRHRFQTRGSRLELRLLLEDPFREPVRRAACELAIDSASQRLRTDAEGRVGTELVPTAQAGTLVLRDTDSALEDAPIQLQIGHLDPIDTFSGQVGRLRNMGYLFAAADDAKAPAFRSAVEEFQCDEGLVVDGVCGPQTQARLEKVHGC
jgi:N-acetylmuramoyl-L-alanine amidase